MGERHQVVVGHDLATYRYFDDVFLRLRIADQLRRVVEIDGGIRCYSACFMTRNWCAATNFHVDFSPGCGRNAYSMLTPLTPPGPGTGGQLVYRDIEGYERVYAYQRGAAVAVGALLSHGTQRTEERAQASFLSFTFGTDKPTYWPRIKGTLDSITQMRCRPDGTLEFGQAPVGRRGRW